MIIYKLNNYSSGKINPRTIKIQFKSYLELKITLTNSLYYYLTKSKNRIDNNVEQWDYYKKITNPYEYIHTPPYPNSSHSVANYFAISRSFYKLIEMVNYFNLIDSFNESDINSFHLAEGPGGFIEALIYLRKNKNDTYHGMTLQSTCKNIPKWRKLCDKFKFNNNIVLENGIKQNGDLMDVENFKDCAKKYKNSMDFITGDGGFDFSINYEKQEISSSKLIFAQIMYAIMMQRRGGKFILKIFDIFHNSTAQLIYFLTTFYQSVTICKPKTSRFANSEKYIVCSHFMFNDTSEYYDVFTEILDSFQKNKEEFFETIFNFDLPMYFIKNIEELNCIFGKKQLATIHTTLQIIDEKRNDKLEKMRKTNIDKSLTWCEKNKIPYHSSFKPENIFTKHLNNK